MWYKNIKETIVFILKSGVCWRRTGETESCYIKVSKIVEVGSYKAKLGSKELWRAETRILKVNFQLGMMTNVAVLESTHETRNELKLVIVMEPSRNLILAHFLAWNGRTCKKALEFL